MLETILKRRSIRKYKSESVPEDKVKQLLQAAMAAPSAGNQQPWHFVVINNRTKLDEIPKFHPYAQMVKEAPLAILVCGDTENEKHKGFWVQDCSAATENLLLAAQALGLGAVWVGVYPRDERVQGFRQLLNIPEGIMPFALVPVGYPAESKQPADRFDESRVHLNSW